MNTPSRRLTRTVQHGLCQRLGSIPPVVGNAGLIAYLIYSQYDSPTLTNACKAAALQIAIWTVEYDGAVSNSNAGAGKAFSFATGNGSDDQTAVYNQVQTYLTGLGSGGPVEFYLASAHPDGLEGLDQDLVGGIPTIPFSVPEPSSFALMGFGLGAFAAFRVRKARRARRDA